MARPSIPLSGFRLHLAACLPLLLAGTVAASQLKGLWLFDDSSNVGKATVGTNLAMVGTPPGWSASATYATKTLTGVITTTAGAPNRLLAIHNIGANGGSATRANSYTLIFDVRRPNNNLWRSFYQTDLTNTNDAEFLTRGFSDLSGAYNSLGQTAIGYTNFILAKDAWVRVVIAAKLGTSFTTYTVSAAGAISSFPHTIPAIDHPGYSLDPSQLILFGDNDGQNNSLTVGQVAVFNGCLTTSEVSSLGVPGTTVTTLPPIIAEGSSRPLEVLKDGPPVDLAFNDSSDNAPVTWSIATAPAHGAAVITSSSSTQCTVRYTPAPGYSGIDAYTVRANNGGSPATSVVNIYVRDPAEQAYPDPVGWWQFDYPSDHILATLGADLSTADSLYVEGVDPFTAAPGIMVGDGAIQVARAGKYRMTHGIAAGTGGGSLVNEYTLLFDVSYSGNAWKTLIQTDPSNTSDGDLFIDPNHHLGTSTLGGYTTKTTAANRWYRVVFSVANGVARRIYVDGQLWHNGNAGTLVNDPLALAPVLGLFEDDDYEDGTLTVSNVAIWSHALDATQAAALGGAGFFIDDTPQPPLNYPPVITEGHTASANVGMVVPTQLTFHVTDGNNDPIQWSLSALPTHGTAQITAASNTEITVSYTSVNGFVGGDSLTLRAADARGSDSIAVTLLVQNSPPVIAGGESYLLSAFLNGGARTATFTATDADSNPMTWNIDSPAQHGMAQITASSTGTCEVAYTPAPGYVGSDSFVVNVSDGQAGDSVTVNVMIIDLTADPVLAVVSAHGTTVPAPGNYSYPAGTPLTPQAADETGTDTRHRCVGWTMIGDGPAAGTDKSFAMTLTRASTLTWLWESDYRVVTAVNGNGTVSVATGWQRANQPLQLTATPASGYYFAGWTGDTAGCQMGGKNIVLPMNRPYAGITANFADDENFHIIVLPDTQFYTELVSPADTYTRQTQWVLDNQATLNIKFLTHVGDLVNVPTDDAQWVRATDAMNLLNTRLAYGTCPGNHDLALDSTHYLDRFGPNPSHASSLGRWINPATNQTYSWYRGASPRGYSSYQIVRINGRDFMFLHLDMDCPDADMAWAASVLSAHPQTLTVITTHNYLAKTGGMGASGSGTGQRGYSSEANLGLGPDRNRPEDVFNALVKPFNQVYMVLCGHMPAIYNLPKINAAGNLVHEVLCDYQTLPNGGNGFLRLMEFRPAQGKIHNTTYSPTLGRYIEPTGDNAVADSQGMFDLHDPFASEFDLDLDFDGRFNSSLTVASAHGGVNPAIGPHELVDGTPFVISAQVHTHSDGQTRHRPTGWTLSGAQNSTGLGSTATLTQQGNATLTWSWEAEYWLDTASTGGGSVNLPDGWQLAGTNVALLAVPNPGTVFLSWNGDIADCVIDGGKITVPMNRPRGPVTAVFDSGTPTFAVTVASDYPSTTPVPAVYPFELGSQATFTADTFTDGDTRHLCTGYQITGASSLSGNTNTVTVTVTSDLTITWNWQTQYRVSATSYGPGTVDTTSIWVDAGTPVMLTATPDSGAAFTAWTGDTSDCPTTTSPTFHLASVTRPTGPVTANFALGMHTLTIVSAANTITPAAGPLVLPHGTVVSFSALPEVTGRTRKLPLGWAIAGTQPASGTTPSGTYVLNADATLTWLWQTEVFLALTSGLEGAVLPLNAAGWKPLGSTVALEARPAPRFQFVRWNGDVPTNSTSPTLSLTMTQPRVVIADVTPQVTTGGTPHWWLDTHARVTAGNYEAADIDDADGDGQTAREEFVAGNNDLDPSLRFQILQTTPVDGPNLLLTWASNTGRNYLIGRSPNLAPPFAPASQILTGSWPSMSALVAATGSRAFFRVQALLPPGTALDADSAAVSPQPAAGSLLRDVCRIPAGWFTCGDNGGVQTSSPAHSTWVAGFDMDRFEVTRGDWETVAAWAATHGYDLPVTLGFDIPANHPAMAVNWYDAVKWCNARSEMEGRVPVYHTDTAGMVIYRTGQSQLTSAHVNWVGNGYRLPTEAEWERASRGGLENQPYPWGSADSLIRANHWDYSEFIHRAPSEVKPYTQRVGFFDGTQPGGAPAAVNAYGLYDMVGNVWEWTWDRMGSYTAEPQLAPLGADTGDARILRGGSWWEFVGQATNSQRLAFPPNGDDINGTNGFRCIRGLHPNESQ